MSGTPAVPRPVGDAARRWMPVVRLLPSDLRTDRGFLQHIASGKDEEAFAWLTSKVDEAAQRVASLRRTYTKLDALVRAGGCAGPVQWESDRAPSAIRVPSDSPPDLVIVPTCS